MKIKFIGIFIFLFILLNGCADERTDEPNHAKKFFNTKKEVIKEFYFVGKDKERIGIYKYNFKEKKHSDFWSDKKEKVILLNYSPDLKHLFFLTAKYYGIRSTLPYIKRIKLYTIDLRGKKITFVDTLKNGTQINAGWISNNSYKVIINSRDLRVAEYMNRHTFIYNLTGKKMMSEIETINFIKNGYPLPVIKNELKTSFGNYQLRNGKVYKDSLYLFDKTTKEINFITTLKKEKINKIHWNDDNLIFTIKGKEKENHLVVYSIKLKKIVKLFENNDVKNFLVFGKYLVFDFGLSFSSSISIFNLKKKEISDSIKFNGGCGLKNVF